MKTIIEYYNSYYINDKSYKLRCQLLNTLLKKEIKKFINYFVDVLSSIIFIIFFWLKYHIHYQDVKSFYQINK